MDELDTVPPSKQTKALGMSTVAFTACFAVWTIFSIIGVRLKGHGTSPYDLQTRDWEEWLAAVRRGYETIAPFAEQVCLVGFSTGGALSLILAAEHPAKLVPPTVRTSVTESTSASTDFWDGCAAERRFR